jgi:hypothetical protein
MSSYELTLALDVQEVVSTTLDDLETISVFRGDTPTLAFTITDGDESTPYDLTDSTVTIAAKKEVTNAHEGLRLEKTCVLSDPTNGQCTVELAVADTDLSGEFVVEIQAEFVSGLVRTLGRFKIAFKQDIVA